jgi:hypothetical protein
MYKDQHTPNYSCYRLLGSWPEIGYIKSHKALNKIFSPLTIIDREYNIRGLTKCYQFTWQTGNNSVDFKTITSERGTRSNPGLYDLETS